MTRQALEIGKSAALGVLLNRLAVTKEHMMVTNYALVKVASEKTPSGKGSRHRAVTNHAIKRNAENAIRLLYIHLNEYLKSLLAEMFSSRPFEVAILTFGVLPDMRHLIVHNASAIDDKFAQTYSEIYGDSPFFRSGAKLPISVGLAKKAIESIKDLCIAIDKGLVQKGYIQPIEKEQKSEMEAYTIPEV